MKNLLLFVFLLAQTMLFAQSEKDYTLTVDGGTLMSECAKNINYTISGIVLNNGVEDITSFDIEVKSSNGTTQVVNFNNSIAPNDAYRYALVDILNTGEVPSEYIVSVINVNGEATPDSFETDNAYTIAFQPIDIAEDKGTFVEILAGNDCGFCLIGNVFPDEMKKRFGKHFTAATIHSGTSSTPMRYTEYEDFLFAQDLAGGYPGAAVDRQGIGPYTPVTVWVDRVVQSLQIEPFVNIELGATGSGNNIKPIINVKFNRSVTNGDYNVLLLVTENNLSNDSDSWDLFNASSVNETEAYGYEYLPLSVPSRFWPYSYVARDILTNSFTGLNEIYGDFVKDDERTVLFPNYPIDPDWNLENLQFIAVLIDDDNEEKVIDAVSLSYDELINGGTSTDTAGLHANSNLHVYPNPTSDVLFIDIALDQESNVQANIVNVEGKIVLSKEFKNLSNSNQLKLNLDYIPAGSYFLQIVTNQGIIYDKLVIE